MLKDKNETHKYRNILLINTFGIGDVLFSVPVIKALAENYPGVNIYYISNRRARYVIKENPHVAECIIFEKDDFRKLAGESKLKFLKSFMRFSRKIKSLNADLMVDFTLNYQAALMGKLLGIPRRIGFNYKGRGRFLTDKMELKGFNDKHVLYYYFDLLKILGIGLPERMGIETFTSEKDDKWAEDIVSKNGLGDKFLLGIVPGGGASWGKNARFRRWPVSNFAHVADRLADAQDIRIVLFGEREEHDTCSNMQLFMHNNALDMSGRTTVGQLMALMKRCNLVLCNEGGPLHIAVALGIPSISIFGPVDSKIYGPFSNDGKHTVISNRQKCKPCYTNFKHKECKSLACLESISEQNVFEETARVIKRLKVNEHQGSL